MLLVYIRHMEKTKIINFGCRLNKFEGQVIEKLLNNQSENQEMVIVNSCAVTSETERQVKQTIRRIKKANPNQKLVLTGCAAQIHPKEYEAMSEVDLVLGNLEKFTPQNYTRQANIVGNIMDIREISPHLAIDTETARSFIMIQQGCDHRCSFCIIPFGRGNNRSVQPEVICQAIRAQIHDSQIQEIVLTGVDIMSYGNDKDNIKDMNLPKLVRYIFHEVPELKFLRLSSLDPAFIDDELIALYEHEPRMQPSVHLSLQSGDAMILKRMKRRHTPSQAQKIIAKLRNLSRKITIGADIIAGFPTESDEMHENTKNFLIANKIEFLHVFPYSQRLGTPAARIPNQVPISIRKQRAQEIRQIGENNLNEVYQKRLGQKDSVLIEQDNRARSPEYFEVALDAAFTKGAIIPIIYTGIANNRLTATAINGGAS